MNEKISDYLYSVLTSVYCNTCRYMDDGMGDDPCEYCYRKSMYWAISKDEADVMADTICKIVEDSK